MNVNGKRVIVCDNDHDDKISKIKNKKYNSPVVNYILRYTFHLLII